MKKESGRLNGITGSTEGGLVPTMTARIKIATVNLERREILVESLENKFSSYIPGGFGLSYEIFKDKWAKNEKMFTIDTGLMTGSGAPGSGAWSITYVSPVTRKLVTECIEGKLGPKLKQNGLEHLCICGKSDSPVYLLIDDHGIRIKQAEHLWDLNSHETLEAIQAECDDFELEIASIGPAKSCSSFSCLIMNYYEEIGVKGLGKVLSNSNLKAIAVNSTGKIKIAYPRQFLELCLKVLKVKPVRQPLQNSSERVKLKYLSPWNESKYTLLGAGSCLYIPEISTEIIAQIAELKFIALTDLNKIRYFCLLEGLSFYYLMDSILEELDENFWCELPALINAQKTTEILNFIRPKHNYAALPASNSSYFPLNCSVTDTAGLCWQDKFPMPGKLEYVASFLSFLTGDSWNPNELAEAERHVSKTYRQLFCRGDS